MTVKSACVVVAALLVAACLAGSAAAQDARLPDRIRTAGTVRAAVQNVYPPLNYTDVATRQLTGFNVELLQALGPKLGVKVDLVVASFEQMFPGLDAGRFDFIGAGLGDYPNRREKLTHVDYLRSGPILLSAEGRANEFKSPADLCGRSVGYLRFIASFATVLKTLNETECVAKGRPPLRPVTDDLTVQLGLAQGRYDAALTAFELLQYLQVSEPGKYHRIGDPLRPWNLAFVFEKDDTQLRDAVAAGVQALIADGTYARLLAKYNLSELAVPQVTIDTGDF